MSIANEIERLQQAKASIKKSIENKGIEVGDITLEQYAGKIDEISGTSQKPSKLEYIEIVGNNCFDTGYIHKSNTNIEAKFRVSNVRRSTSGWSMLFGARKVSYTSNAFGFFTNFNGQNRFGYCRTGNEAVGTGLYTQDLTLKTEGKKVTYGYSIYNYSITTTGTLDNGVNNLLIGAINSGEANKITLDVSTADTLRIYYFKIFEDSTLVKHFVPYRNEKGIIGLLDLVSNEFIKPFNDFIVGADID